MAKSFLVVWIRSWTITITFESQLPPFLVHCSCCRFATPWNMDWKTSHILPNQNITILTSLYIWYLTRSGAVQLLQIYHSLKYGLEDIPAFTISNISRLRLTIHNLLDVQFIMLTSYTIWTIHLHIRIWLEDIPEPLWSQSNISRLRFTICNSWCLQCTLNIQFTMLKIYNSWCSQFTLNVQFTN